MWYRESDGVIVPMKASNVAGGKDATQQGLCQGNIHYTQG